MGRRLLFVLGLVSAAYGGWLFNHERTLNAWCNSAVADPRQGFTINAKCLNIVWPYAEGFLLVIVGALLIFAALMMTRRVMSGEHQYLKDLKAGKYNRENDHNNSYNFDLQLPTVKIGAGSRLSLRDAPHE